MPQNNTVRPFPDLPSMNLNDEDQLQTDTMVVDSDSQSDEPAPKVHKLTIPEVSRQFNMIEECDSAACNWLDDIVCVGVEKARPKSSPIEICQKEIDRYITDEAQITNVCPIRWWEQKEKFYPTISSVARRILAIPASSVPSERIFSLAGALVTKKRSQLSPENVNLLIFLKKNA